MHLRTYPRAQLAELWRIDSRLAVLGRGVGAMRLRLGEGLLALEALGGIQALGFPTLDSYAREALGRSGRWSADARALARRLGQLPKLRAALVAGPLTTSMVELVARVATPEDEAEWIARATHMTVRALRLLLRGERLEVEDDSAPPRGTITATVSRVEAWAFERARAMVEAVGAARGEATIEALLAEGLGELMALDGDLDLPTSIVGSDEDRALRVELALLRERAEAAAEAAVPPEMDPVEAAEVEDGELAEDVAVLDAQLRAAARNLAARDVELARLARQALDHEIWRTLRFHSFDHYCRERIGLSPSSVATRIALARRMERLPEVEAALVVGHIGYEAAALVARVAGPETVAEWVTRASQRTVKHLREEVDAVELVARVEGRPVWRVGPPDLELLDDVQAVERAAIRVVTDQVMEGQMSGSAEDGEGQMSGSDEREEVVGLPTTTLRMAVSEDIACFWRGLERVFAYVRPGDESFVGFLVRAATRTWGGSVAGGAAYAQIYERDRWRCASPVCRSRNVTPHHVVFRSRGGSDEQGNLVSLCEKCHLELVHGGRMQVSGDADGGLMWRALGWGVDGRAASPLTASASALAAR